jgi:prepilin-type N-terminal cleavage/methylation domain-containing protein
MGRRGFTLIEVIVALTIGAIAVTLSVAIFSNVSVGIERVTGAIAVHDRRSNAREWMADVFSYMTPVGREAEGFKGDSRAMSFSSRVWDPSGAHVASRIALEFRDSSLVARSSVDTVTVLASGLVSGRFDYIEAYGSTVPFSIRWESRISAPLAVRVLLGRRGTAAATIDTLFFWIGTRT